MIYQNSVILVFENKANFVEVTPLLPYYKQNQTLLVSPAKWDTDKYFFNVLFIFKRF